MFQNVSFFFCCVCKINNLDNNSYKIKLLLQSFSIPIKPFLGDPLNTLSWLKYEYLRDRHQTLGDF